MSNYAVEVKNVKKQFSYSRHKNNSLKRAITQVFKKKDTAKDSFFALNGISFNVEKGDFFGILGRNGSGKSTLLKIISEIYQPTSGSVKHDGKLVSFIELGVGFNSELTGKENVYLNGALLGFSKAEVEAMYDDIVEFAELEKFMDQTLKNYSSGMKVRLAFSVAIRAKADILILDEVLAVGDAAFQKKCTDYFETLKGSGKTVILVTHSMGSVRQFCNKAVVIDDGCIIFAGGADESADVYLSIFEKKEPGVVKPAKHKGVELVSASTKVEKDYVNINFVIHNKTNTPMSDLYIFADILRNTQIVTGFLTADIGEGIDLSARETKTLELRLKNIFGKGSFCINATLRDGTQNNEVIDSRVDIVEFENIFGKDEYYPIEAIVERV